MATSRCGRSAIRGWHRARRCPGAHRVIRTWISARDQRGLLRRPDNPQQLATLCRLGDVHRSLTSAAVFNVYVVIVRCVTQLDVYAARCVDVTEEYDAILDAYPR